MGLYDSTCVKLGPETRFDLQGGWSIQEMSGGLDASQCIFDDGEGFQVPLCGFALQNIRVAFFGLNRQMNA